MAAAIDLGEEAGPSRSGAHIERTEIAIAAILGGRAASSEVVILTVLIHAAVYRAGVPIIAGRVGLTANVGVFAGPRRVT